MSQLGLVLLRVTRYNVFCYQKGDCRVVAVKRCRRSDKLKMWAGQGNTIASCRPSPGCRTGPASSGSRCFSKSQRQTWPESRVSKKKVFFSVLEYKGPNLIHFFSSKKHIQDRKTAKIVLIFLWTPYPLALDVVKRLYRDARKKDEKKKLRQMVTELSIIDTGVTEPTPKKDEHQLSVMLGGASLADKVETNDISLAIASGDLGAVSVYLGAGHNPNFVNERGHSLLQCAFAAKNETIVEMLLKNGAGKIFSNFTLSLKIFKDPNRPFSHGSLPLHRACVCARFKIRL